MYVFEPKLKYSTMTSLKTVISMTNDNRK